jgi:hypothetical protein
MSEQELQPTPEEIQLEEPDTLRIQPVPVSVEGTVVAQIAGSRVGTSRSIPLGTTPEVILPADPRRRRAVLLADAAARFGTRDDVDADYGFMLYAFVPVELTHVDEVWARSDSGTVTLSVLVEEWTE